MTLQGWAMKYAAWHQFPRQIPAIRKNHRIGALYSLDIAETQLVKANYLCVIYFLDLDLIERSISPNCLYCMV